MQSRSIAEYFFFGTVLRYLQDSAEGWKVHSTDRGAWVYDNILFFFRDLKKFNLSVTERAADAELRALSQKFADLPKDHQLTTAEASDLRRIMIGLRPTLEAEANGHVAFIVTDKRIQVTRLLDNVGALFAPGIVDALPAIAKLDLAEAGKCVAFERPTAAAFHLMRATEAVLRHFYCCVVKRDRVDPLMWWSMVDSMRKRKKPPAGPLLNNLDNIREHYRNPTQHPDKVYDINEVQDLFGLCIDVINRMVTTPQWRPVTTTVAHAPQP